MIRVIRNIDPSRYSRSPLHADDRTWPEKNCYVDLWIEVLHALRMETRAMLPFVVAGDFEDDQWTFFKPAHEDLFDLFGIEVQELTVWKPLIEHAVIHLAAGKLISTEADAFWLPDVAGTDYQRNHSKTTIVLNAIDPDGESLEYFHNASYYRLEGEDFRQLFRVGSAPDSGFLPLFAEIVRIDRARHGEPTQLARRSLELLRRYFSRRAVVNPVRKLGAHFEQQLPILQERGLDYYHLWAFGSVRQLGAASELLAENLAWLDESGALPETGATACFRNVSSGCKAFILKGARAVSTRRGADLKTQIEQLAVHWEGGMRNLQGAL
ncbi:MAG: DUF1839 family protein [Pseudomonadota bacterium]|nr:DUF1839 family protein [Pseudomonadota bacterium]